MFTGSVNKSGNTVYYYYMPCVLSSVLSGVLSSLLVSKCFGYIKLSIGTVNKAGQAPLSLASARGHLNIVKYLIETHHCDPGRKYR